MILVLGGGFGMYGHAPALVDRGTPVASLARYRPFAAARPELAPYLGRIAWEDNEEEAIRRADTIVLARRPADNVALARQIMKRHGPRPLVLEKPIARTPDEADAFVEDARAIGSRFATPYLFLHCDWFDALQQGVAGGGIARIDWMHTSLPPAESWKSRPAEGGGTISFYLIQALAAAENLLPSASIEATMERGGTIRLLLGGRLSIRFSLGMQPSFRVSAGGREAFRGAGPFGALPRRGSPDPRLPALDRFYQMMGKDLATAPPPGFHLAVHALWRRVCAAIGGLP